MSKNPAKIGRSRYHQSIYKPTNPKKYIGDVDNILCRSSWERKVCHKLDHANYVIAWSCEPFAIKYIKPSTGLYHRYFPDFLIVTINSNGEKITTLCEVKPSKEQFPPKSQGKKKSRYLKECLTYEVNIAKWAAAKKLCKKKGWNWCVLTEKEILGKKT